MKKLIILLGVVVAMTSMTSCATLDNFLSGRPSNSVLVQDYNEQMRLVRLNFPEIYYLYKQGKIMIYEVYTYEKNDKEIVRVGYRYR